MYDGLCSSTSITYFDNAIQKKLHKAYSGVKRCDKISTEEEINGKPGYSIGYYDGEWVRSIANNANEAIVVVEEFRDKNRYRSKWLSLLKILRLEYED